MKPWMAVIGIVVVVAAACGGGGSPSHHTLHGRTVLFEANDNGYVADPTWGLEEPFEVDAQGLATGGRCKGVDAHSDLDHGARVVVRDADGKIVAASSLGFGYSADVNEGSCLFKWTARVPDSAFYSVTIGDQRPVVYKRGELAHKKWVAGSVVSDF